MLAAWYGFYALAGAAAATLAGLLFVTVTLSVGLSLKGAFDGAHAFLTPALVHFCGVLIQALIVLAPWPADRPAGLFVGALRLAGLGYTTSVVMLLRKQKVVSLELNSWIIYAGVPFISNASQIVGGIGLIGQKPFAPFVIAGSTTLLLLIGVIQAWDLTLWIIKNRGADV